MKSASFTAFLICGGLAALMNLFSRWVFSNFWPYELSITIAYGLGMATGFILFKFFVFDSGQSRKTAKETFWFVIVNVLALLQTLVVSLTLAEYLFPAIGFTFRPYDVAHLFGVGVPVISSYFGHKYLTFRK